MRAPSLLPCWRACGVPRLLHGGNLYEEDKPSSGGSSPSSRPSVLSLLDGSES